MYVRLGRLILQIFPVKLHPLCQQKDIVSYCTKNGIAVQAYCPIIRGNFDEPVIQAIAQKVRGGRSPSLEGALHSI